MVWVTGIGFKLSKILWKAFFSPPNYSRLLVMQSFSRCLISCFRMSFFLSTTMPSFSSWRNMTFFYCLHTFACAIISDGFFMLSQHTFFSSCCFAFCMFVSIVFLVWKTCLTCYLFTSSLFFWFPFCMCFCFSLFPLQYSFVQRYCFAFIRLQYISTDYCVTPFQYMWLCITALTCQHFRVCFALCFLSLGFHFQ